ncbi:hypothetical protein [Micromonospora sp. C95]|uniref:hypothetical protein n=1 Tax=Micromonospora sp. C95 TaxID=2824882 RepID=UPI001B378E53|nr:hypothetical protein [Micromonospora sp. C95]
MAVVLAATAALLLDDRTRILALPLLLFAAIGLVEDLRGVAVRVRLVLQLLAGLLTGLVLLDDDQPLTARAVALLVVAVWLTAYSNAFNFMDGVNGISATQAILAGWVYVALGLMWDLPVLTSGGAIVAAAATTFLPWNAGRAKIFLGDVGAYSLGGILGTFAVYGLLSGVPAEAALAPLALYLADTGWTLARRIRRGEPWYRAHRSHVYQRLTDVGWSHQRVTTATAFVGAAAASCFVAAAVGGSLVRVALDVVGLAILAGYLSTPSRLTSRPTRPQPADRSVHA